MSNKKSFKMTDKIDDTLRMIYKEFGAKEFADAYITISNHYRYGMKITDAKWQMLFYNKFK